MNPTIDNYYYIPTPLTDSSGLPIMRCIPKMETNVIALYANECVPYTMADVNSSQKLPKKICDKVRAGETVYHSPTLEKLFGYNTFEPVADLDKASSYVVKYVSKEIGSTPFKMRYWSSRGLARAERMATYYFPEHGDYSHQLEEYNKYMLSVAAVTKSYHAMHQESYLTVKNRTKKSTESQHLVNITTYINGCEHSSASILEHMDITYDSSPHYVTFKPDSLLATQEEVTSAQVQLNLMHSYLVASKLRQECLDLQKAEQDGLLEWIDYNPFIHLTKDNPLLKCFSSPTHIPSWTQLSLYDLQKKFSSHEKEFHNEKSAIN